MLNKNPAKPRKGKDRRPGKKSALPPRNPIASKLPNLTVKERRSAETLAVAEANGLEVQAEILKEIDFADDNVLDALEHGRKKARNAGKDADLFDEIIQGKAINDEIAWAVRVYISAMAFAINPNDFRSAIKAFGSALEKFMREIATKGHLIEIAIKHELRLQAHAQESSLRLDFDLLAIDLGKLLFGDQSNYCQRERPRKRRKPSRSQAPDGFG